jgi:ferredoxin
MISRKIVLHFPNELVDQPIICKLVKDFDLEFNILKAYVTPKEEGLLVLELSGEKTKYKKGVQYLSETGVKIQPLSQEIIRNETRCTDCSVCVAICPVNALVVEPSSRKVQFHQEECIACELCIKACPVRAMEVHF